MHITKDSSYILTGEDTLPYKQEDRTGIFFKANQQIVMVRNLLWT